MQNPIVKLLAYPQVDWDSFISLCLEYLGHSPTRGLDKKGIDLTKPVAFPASLDLENRCELKPYTLRHSNISFIIIADKDVILNITIGTSLHISGQLDVRRRDYFAIVTGDVEEWCAAVLDSCGQHSSYDHRYIFNACYIYLERAGFKELFNGFRQEKQNDGTFILKQA